MQICLKFFKKRFLSFIRPMSNSIYNIHNLLEAKCLKRLRIGFTQSSKGT